MDIRFWAPQYKKDNDVQRQIQLMASVVRRLENLTYAKRPRQLFLFSIKKRKVRGHLIAACSY